MKRKAADKIEEGSWLNIVVKELNDISNDCAKQLQKGIGGNGWQGFLHLRSK